MERFCLAAKRSNEHIPPPGRNECIAISRLHSVALVGIAVAVGIAHGAIRRRISAAFVFGCGLLLATAYFGSAYFLYARPSPFDAEVAAIFFLIQWTLLILAVSGAMVAAFVAGGAWIGTRIGRAIEA